jgi:hypothetical protein
MNDVGGIDIFVSTYAPPPPENGPLPAPPAPTNTKNASVPVGGFRLFVLPEGVVVNVSTVPFVPL